MATLGGTNLGLWLPPVVLAHLFALFWLYHSLQRIYPGALPSRWRRRRRHGPHGNSQRDSRPGAHRRGHRAK
jgi:hypothetical protein